MLLTFCTMIFTTQYGTPFAAVGEIDKSLHLFYKHLTFKI